MAGLRECLAVVRLLFSSQPVPSVTTRMCLLDGLRGIAACAVIMFHYDHFMERGPEMSVPAHDVDKMPLFAWLAPLYQHGNLAVQIFWIISGFVFAAVYYGRHSTTRSFMINRFARLYPLHILTLCVVAALQIVAVQEVGHWLIYGNNTLPVFISQTLFYAWNSDHGWSFNGPIWSVSVEAVVYVLFWSTHAYLPRIGMAGPAAICLLSMILLHIIGHNLVVVCSFYFFFGSTLALVQSRLAHLPRIGLASALVALVGSLIVAVAPAEIRDYVGIPTACAGLIMLLVGLEDRVHRRVRAIGSRLGDYSYGIYLWHVPIQLVLLLSLGRFVDVALVARQPGFLFLFMGLVFGVAILSFHLYEAPARRLIRSASEDRSRGPAIAAP